MTEILKFEIVRANDDFSEIVFKSLPGIEQFLRLTTNDLPFLTPLKIIGSNWFDLSFYMISGLCQSGLVGFSQVLHEMLVRDW